MTKDEMKNRISMALKDDVLQQGFEIICKNLAELEKENDELKANNQFLNNLVREKEQRGLEIQEDLLRENAELDCQMHRNKYCHSCVNATDKCFRKEIGCPCEKYKSYKDENTKLKEENKFLKEQCLILTDGNVCNSTFSEIKKQLTKAKGIVKDYMTIVKGAHTTVCGVPEENRTINVLKLCEQAEQFISEVEK